MELKWLIKVLMPFAKTIACLESSQSNPADVYLFWLTILTSFKHLFPIQSQIVYNCVLAYLGKLAEAEWRTKEHPILAHFSCGSDLVLTFKNQFHSYSLLRYPFDKLLAPGQSVCSWWCSLLEHLETNVLAVSPCFLAICMLCHLTTHQVH